MAKETMDLNNPASPIPDVKIFTNEGASEITYRTGPAPRLIEPKKVEIYGDIKTVSTFLKTRYAGKIGFGLQVVDPAKAIVYVDKENLTIQLLLDPESIYGSSVSGQLSLAPELETFGINTSKKYTRDAFIELVEFNGIYFANSSDWKILLNSLKKLTSSIVYKNNESSDERGNKDMQFRREVETNVPAGFNLEIPVYKGFGNEPVAVDICIGVKQGVVEFWFQSVALNDLLKTKVDVIFNEQLTEAAGLVIIYK